VEKEIVFARLKKFISFSVGESPILEIRYINVTTKVTADKLLRENRLKINNLNWLNLKLTVLKE